MNHQKFSSYNFIRQSGSTSFLVLLGCLIAGFFIAQFGSVVAVALFNGFDINAVFSILSPPFTDESTRVPLLLAQGANSFILFIATPFFYLHFYEQVNPKGVITAGNTPNSKLLLITIVLVIVYMPISAYTAFWNESIEIPGAFGELAQKMEEQLKELTLFMVNFSSFGQFLLGLIIIAVIPGIGEELLFRGVIQNKILKSFGNVHLAIWITAFLFSAFHFQFYGFIPRMLLGGLFGYLYIWSGSIIVPMLAHFVNNGFTLLMMYLNKSGASEIEIDSPDSYSLLGAVVSIILVSGIIWYFRQINNKNISEI